jgi:hypothetical protein
MAGNIASEVTKFLKAEGQKQLRNVASDVVAGVVGGSGGRRAPEQVRRRSNLLGVAMTPGGVFTQGITRGVSGKLQRYATSAGGMVAKGATDESGAALQGSIEMAKNQVNAFTNLFTAPGIKSIGDFFSVMADAPRNVLSFGEALLSVTGKLKDVSPAFAAISAEQEVRQLERDIRTGEQTGGSATALSEAMEDFKDSMLPVQNDIYNTTAELVTDLIPIAKQIYAIMGPFFKSTATLLAEVVKQIAKVVVPIMITILEIIQKLFLLIRIILTVAGTSRFFGVFKKAAQQMGPIMTTLSSMLDGIRDLNKDEDETEKINAHQIAIAALRMRTNEVTKPKPPSP